jgi:N-methylhydantoinase A
VLEAVRVIASGRPEKFEETQSDSAPAGAVEATGSRRVFRPEAGDWADLPIYQSGDLGNGAAVEGPAIVEHPMTTILVPEEWRLEVDEFGNYRLEDLAVPITEQQDDVTPAYA